MKSVLLSGQSNAIGAGYGGSLAGISSNVTVWNNTNPLGGPGTAFIAPVLGSSPFNNGSSNNLGLWLCHAMASDLNEPVQLTLVGKNGTPISEWVSSDDGLQPMADEIISVHTAQATGVPYDVFAWMQGENDSAVGYSVYEPRFIEMLGLLTAAGVIDGNTKIVIGGLDENQANGPTFNNNVLKPIAANHGLNYASSTGLATDYTGGVWHFSAAGLYEFGHRFWDAIKHHFLNFTTMVFIDDEEQRDFLPTLVGTTMRGTGTYLRRGGFATQKGKRATANIALNLTGHSGVGNMEIRDLPYAARWLTPVTVLVQSIASPANTIVRGYVSGNKIVLNAQTISTGAAALLALDGTGEIYCSVEYPTN